MAFACVTIDKPPTPSRSRAACVLEALEDRRLMDATLFRLDPSRSVISATGTIGFLRYPLVQQASPSLTTRFEGIIGAELSPDGIRIDSTASLITAMNSGDWQPEETPQLSTFPGRAPAAYGARVDGGEVSSAFAAVRDLSITVGTDTIPLGEGGTFPSTGLQFSVRQGRLDFSDWNQQEAGSYLLQDELAVDVGASPSRYAAEGGVPTLTLTVAARLEFAVQSTTRNDSYIDFKGTIVATPIDLPPPVAARHVFYNGSAYDGGSPAPDAADDAAVAPYKYALLPGQNPTFANVTGSDRGITGIMLDVRGLPAGAAPTAADFVTHTGTGGDPAQWATGPAPSAVAVRRGAGVDGSDRVTLTFPAGSIRNTWVEVKALANARTGLPARDVSYFGNLVGETGAGSPLRVEYDDYLATRAGVSSRSTPRGAGDHTGDGRVNPFDLVRARANQGRTLEPPAAPPAEASAVAPVAPPARRRDYRAATGQLL
jgi:hypothetical protein